MDKLTALRVFRRVGDLGSFSAAARDLDLSPAAVGKNIRELETELGVRLLNRTTRRMHLTDLGQRFLERTRKLLDDLADAEAEATDTTTAVRGRLSVIAPMSLGIAKVAAAIGTFQADNPQIAVDLQLDDRNTDIVAGGFDLAIRAASRLRDSSLVARRLARFDRILCAAPSYLEARGHPRAPSDLASHACLIYSLAATPRHWRLQGNGDTATVVVSGKLQVNNSLALVQSAVAGHGIALVPGFAAERELASGALERILDEWHPDPLNLWALVPRHRQEARAVRMLVEWLQRNFRSSGE